mmetsp:Transcript_53727/g.140742  ORF Transcript_53727/g.140742 Transcript_53727/m.140742 type:complete len:235 (-) Transcript_53727:365-1069(-)
MKSASTAAFAWTCAPGTNSSASDEPSRPRRGLPDGLSYCPGTNSGVSAESCRLDDACDAVVPKPATALSAARAMAEDSGERPSSIKASGPIRPSSSAQQRRARASEAAVAAASPSSLPAESSGAQARLHTPQPSPTDRRHNALAEPTSEQTTRIRPAPRPSRATTPLSPSTGTEGGTWPEGAVKYTKWSRDAMSGHTDRSMPTSQTTTPLVSGDAKEARPNRQNRGRCRCTTVW